MKKIIYLSFAILFM